MGSDGFRVGSQTLQASVKVIDRVATPLQPSPTPLGALHLCDEIIGASPPSIPLSTRA
jgi:hypothetical protein